MLKAPRALIGAALILAAGRVAAQVRISQLPAAAALAGTEAVPVVQSGLTRQTTTGAIANLTASLTNALTFGGIDPTGATDSTAGLQAAISSGSSLFLPCGIYVISANLKIDAAINDGQMIVGAGSTDAGESGACKTIIRPTSAVTNAFKINGADFGGYVQNLAIRDLAVDMVNMPSGSNGFYEAQAYDVAYSNVRVVSAPPSSGSNSWYFAPGAFLTQMRDCAGGSVTWSASGTNDPRETTIVNCDLQSIQATYASNLTFVGGGIASSYYSGLPVIWVPAGSANTPVGLTNSAGIYLFIVDELANTADVNLIGADIGANSGFPSTYNDGTHGSLPAYAAIQLNAAVETLLTDPTFVNLYLYDPTRSTTFFGAHASGGSADIFGAPTWLTNTLRGYPPNGVGQSFLIDPGSGYADFAGLTLQPLSSGADGGVFTILNQAGTGLLVFNTATGVLQLENNAGWTAYSDSGATKTTALSGGILSGYAAGLQTYNLYSSTGLGSFAALQLRILSGGSDGQLLNIYNLAGSNLLDFDTSLRLLQIENGAGLTLYSDGGTTPTLAANGATGLLQGLTGAGETWRANSAAGTFSTTNEIYPGTTAGAEQSASGWLESTGAPSTGGANGDFAIRSDGVMGSLTTFYHKEGGSWVSLGAGLNTYLAAGVPSVTTTATTFSGLPGGGSAVQGQRAFITDDSNACTFGTAAAGGGATKCPVYYDGAWKAG
ncbi:MAG TPA: hypothetical protein VGS12_07510 [Caulobacteraceae bacterium]|nr:hypothetical protein [Caulobacteraceae bacterium]